MTRRIGFRLCAAILVVAASLKAYSLLSAPIPRSQLWSSWRQSGLVIYELALAAWLLTEWKAEWARRVAVGTFSLFFLYALSLGASGYESCGCFGQLKVSPWLTAALDAVCLAGLLSGLSRGGSAPPESGKVCDDGRRLLPASVLAAAALSFASVMLVKSMSHSGSVRGLTFTNGLVVLDPPLWIGSTLPIREFLAGSEPLDSGRWKVVFYHHDCGTCRTVVRSHAADARGGQTSDGWRLAFVEVPPLSRVKEVAELCAACHHWELSEDREWFVSTPSVVTLNEGVVVAVSSD